MATSTHSSQSNVIEVEELWRHPTPDKTRMWNFMQRINQRHRLKATEYKDLYSWSILNVDLFWREVWDYVGIKASRNFEKAVEDAETMFPRPPFFPGARLNFAENLLFPVGLLQPLDQDSPALIAATETTRESVSWNSLRERVRRCQASLKDLSVQPGDRLAGFVGNHVNAIVFMLAATSLGAIWTAVSPDSGVSMVLDRLLQIEPKILVADVQQEYNGKLHDVVQKVNGIITLVKSLSSVVVLPNSSSNRASSEDVQHPDKGRTYHWDDFLSLGKADAPLTFEQLGPDHPIYILYSSGTTGAPKCIVHGAIGTLIQHKKEHILHCDIRPGERLFYFTTCTWMMWHWLVSGLASGATLILYDGSPMRYQSNPDDLAMPRLIDELSINHFGTSAKYLSMLEQKSLHPQSPPHSLALSPSPLRSIFNTASPLAPSTFRYIYQPTTFGPDVHLASITGGTDIISLFGAGNPLLPVKPGAVQAPGLGMAIRALDPDTSVDVTTSGQPGDLVCARPFPCQPVGFWPLGDAAGAARYKAAYFERFTDPDRGKAIWHHGDFVAFDAAEGPCGGMVMLGRSDGVLNPAGVRFGSAEVYNVLLKSFPGVVADGICVGRRRADEADETVCLFVKMEDEGTAGFDDGLRGRIKAAVRKELSPRHVPAVVEACPDIPVTVNGKKVENAVKKIISGATAVKTSASVANAASLDFFREWAARNP